MGEFHRMIWMITVFKVDRKYRNWCVNVASHQGRRDLQIIKFGSEAEKGNWGLVLYRPTSRQQDPQLSPTDSVMTTFHDLTDNNDNVLTLLESAIDFRTPGTDDPDYAQRTPRALPYFDAGKLAQIHPLLATQSYSSDSYERYYDLDEDGEPENNIPNARLKADPAERTLVDDEVNKESVLALLMLSSARQRRRIRELESQVTTLLEKFDQLEQSGFISPE